MHKNPYDMNMTSSEERDFLLWRFLQKDLNPQESILVENHLSHDKEWQDALLHLQKEEEKFSHLESEIPSMRFSKNVMEAIAAAPIAKPTRSYINTKLMKTIGFAMMACVVSMLVYAFAQVKWSTPGKTSKDIPVKLPKVNVNWDFTQGNFWLYGCFAIVIVCFFILADKFLTSKRKYKME